MHSGHSSVVFRREAFLPSQVRGFFYALKQDKLSAISTQPQLREALKTDR